MAEQTSVLASYDSLAPHLRAYSQTRTAYLSTVDRLIWERVRPGARSMLDVGSGDGVRGARLAAAIGIDNLVLSEPSEEMLLSCRRQAARVWATSAEQLPSHAERFAVITCLWNVLGLVGDAPGRLAALQRMKHLLASDGQLFLDVNNRYNAAAYGWAPTIGRIIYDRVSPAETNGDVVFTWRLGECEIQSKGHVFRPGEIRELIRAAGWEVREGVVINYETGRLCRNRFGGQLFYELTPK